MTKNLEYDWFPPAANGWGTIHPIPDKTHHSRLKRRVHQPKKK
jgi:hypothetical protein